MFLALQSTFPPESSHGGQAALPHGWPLPRLVLKALARMLPPASWNLTLKPVISAILSSSSLRLLTRVLPLVLGTNTTVAFGAWVPGLFPAFRKTFLFLILPLVLDGGKGFHASPDSFSIPLNHVALFIALALALRFLLHPAFGNSGWYPGLSWSRRLLFTLLSKDLTPCSTACLMNSSVWPLVFIFVHALSTISSLLEGSNLRLVFLNLLEISSDRVDIFTSLLSAEPASTMRLEAIGFS